MNILLTRTSPLVLKHISMTDFLIFRKAKKKVKSRNSIPTVSLPITICILADETANTLPDSWLRLLKYRFGNYERDREIDGEIRPVKTDMNSFIIGIGGGYKLVKFDSFTVAPFVSIARNFSEEVSKEFMGIEVNAGVTVGYRF